MLNWTRSSRRLFLATGGLAAAALFAPNVIGSSSGALAATPTVADLMAPQPLPDLWIGKADAPVTIIEYASMTCPHCGDFHAEAYPTLKKDYIDAGKVRFVLREFPLDPLAAAAFMVARCMGPDKRNAMVDLLFDQQKNWAFIQKPLDGLIKVVEQAGMTKQQFDDCLKDKKLYDQVNDERDTASKKYGVDATPTFFINGKKVEGEMSADELKQTLAPFLKG